MVRSCQREWFHPVCRFFHRPGVVARKHSRPFIRHVRLTKVKRREKLQIESGFARQGRGHWLIELHRNPEPATLWPYIYSIVQPTIVVNTLRRYLVRCVSSLPSLVIRYWIPLLRRRRQANVASCSDSLVLQNDLQSIHLLVAENLVIRIMEQQNLQPMALQNIL